MSNIFKIRTFEVDMKGTGYLIAKRAKKFCSGEDIDLDFC